MGDPTTHKGLFEDDEIKKAVWISHYRTWIEMGSSKTHAYLIRDDWTHAKTCGVLTVLELYTIARPKSRNMGSHHAFTDSSFIAEYNIRPEYNIRIRHQISPLQDGPVGRTATWGNCSVGTALTSVTFHLHVAFELRTWELKNEILFLQRRVKSFFQIFFFFASSWD